MNNGRINENRSGERESMATEEPQVYPNDLGVDMDISDRTECTTRLLILNQEK